MVVKIVIHCITIALKYQTKQKTNFGKVLYDKFKMQTEINLSLNDHNSFKFQLRAPTINIHLSPSILILSNHVDFAKYAPRVRIQPVSEHKYPCCTRISCKHNPESKPLHPQVYDSCT